VVQVGDEVQVKVLEVRPEERRMTLSIRQAQEETGDYGDYEPDPDRVTLGDVYGGMLERGGDDEE
jgi:small subunit ribosomal protein S1